MPAPLVIAIGTGAGGQAGLDVRAFDLSIEPHSYDDARQENSNQG